MKNIFKKASFFRPATRLAFGVLCALTGFAATSASAQDTGSSNPWHFEKNAFKPDGTPWSGPVNVGDTVNYVLSYTGNGVEFSGPVKIEDTLSPNQSYVGPITATPGWTWSATPYASGNSERFINPKVGPNSGSVQLDVPMQEDDQVDATYSTPSVESLFCTGAPADHEFVFAWTTVNILSAGASGTLIIKKVGSPDTTIAITPSLTSYPIGAIGNGTAGIAFAFAGSAGSATKLRLQVDYQTSKPSEICYQAEVTTCGPVTNTAVMGSASASGSGQASASQMVDLGEAQGENCEVPTPPTPAEGTCFSGDPNVTCGREPGTFIVTIDPTNAGGEMPTHVEVEPLTAGVMLSSSTPVVPVRDGQAQFTLVGANPGDTITLMVSGSTLDPSSETGMSVCCGGEIEVIIPEDIDCDQSGHDLAVVKTGGTSPAPSAPYYAFEITASNPGNVINETSAIYVTDTVPDGMVFDSAAGMDWSCSPLPANAGETVSCIYTGGGPVVPGQVLPPISIAATATGDGPYGAFENCANVGTELFLGLTDVYAFNNQSCVTVDKPEHGGETEGEDQMEAVDHVDLSATKIWETEVALTSGQFTISVVNEGAQIDPPTVIKIREMIPANMTLVSLDPSSTWTCDPLPVTGPAVVECSYDSSQMPAAAGAGLMSDLVFNATIDSLPGKPGTPMDLENCARVDGYVTFGFATPLVDDNPLDNVGCASTGMAENRQQTADPDVEPPEGRPELTVSKSVSGACRVDRDNQVYECPFDIEVTNTGDAPSAGSVVLTDEFGKGGIRPGTLAGEGWGFLAAQKGMVGLAESLALAPGQSSAIQSTVIVRGQRDGGTFENCAVVGYPTDTKQALMLAQDIMNKRGIDVGKVDGKIGPNTRAGLEKLRAELGLPPSNELDESVFAALGLAPQAEGTISCAVAQLPPMPAPVLKCDAKTTVERGGSCVCKFKNMSRSNATSCACVRGYELDGRNGCVMAPASEPKPVPNAAKCDFGQIMVEGRCIKVPKCGFGQIPVPGTSVCIGIGGGGSKDPDPLRP